MGKKDGGRDSSDAHDTTPPHRNNRGSSQPPRKHPKSKKSGSGGKLGSNVIKFCSILVLPVILGYFGFEIHQQLIVLPALVNTPSSLPTILAHDHFSPENSPDKFWGSYRANLYFGMRTRSPKSPVVGLMWFNQPIQEEISLPKIRHWCDQNDGLSKYAWMEHDGKSFGRQEIYDHSQHIQTSFVKRPGGSHGGDWSAHIVSVPIDDSAGVEKKVTVNSFIIYIALSADDTDGSYMKPFLLGSQQMQYIDHIEGYTPELGHFKLRFNYRKASNVLAKSYLAARMEPTVDLSHLSELVMGGTGIIKLESKFLTHYLGLMGTLPNHPPPNKPNFLALQITYLTSTDFDIIYESGSFPERNLELSGDAYDAYLSERREKFEEKFEQLFGLKEKQYPDIYKEMGHVALSNMLGSIGYFHGYSKVISPYNRHPVPYGPLTLFSTIPSRPFFPRGFIWDEGFHQLLLRKWDPELSLEILASWLDLMNVEGWIPREMILGSEAEIRVPDEYIVQGNKVANPPMFFYLISQHLKDKEVADAHKDYFVKVYPRLKLWYNWLNSSQSGTLVGTYRWRGRNETTDRELNPKTLPSGLDDYPRASHPTSAEYHVDLFCWMAMSTAALRDLSQLVSDNSEHQSKLKETAAFLGDSSVLDSFHWSDKNGRYCDYGLHTRHLKLEKPKPTMSPDGRPRPPVNMDMYRAVLREPQARLVSDTLGYVSLFPLFLRLIPAESPKLERILKQLEDPDLLWSRFGLRSLAKTSPLYGVRNTEHDPPYWRGSVWMNMNYLALSALHHYSSLPGPHRDTAFLIYGKLRGAVVSNVVREYQRTGYLWEHYNDETGVGEGSHPFTGWTSLVLLMMSEQYD